jgi:hypothetical protein
MRHPQSKSPPASASWERVVDWLVRSTLKELDGRRQVPLPLAAEGSEMNSEAISLAQMVDKICLAVAFVLPILVVIRWNWYGVVLGTLIHWGTLFVAGELISEIAPGSRGDCHGMLDILWLLGGWVSGVVYCLVIFAIKCLVLFLMRLGRTDESKTDGTRT